MFVSDLEFHRKKRTLAIHNCSKYRASISDGKQVTKKIIIIPLLTVQTVFITICLKTLSTSLQTVLSLSPDSPFLVPRQSFPCLQTVLSLSPESPFLVPRQSFPCLQTVLSLSPDSFKYLLCMACGMLELSALRLWNSFVKSLQANCTFRHINHEKYIKITCCE